MAAMWEKLRGRFIVFDGPDGSGKGTQIERLKALLISQGLAVTQAKDPGGTPIGDRIRHVLLDFDLSEMDVRCETLLFMASRAQLVARVIRPAIARGDVVLCDRFVSATCAYQGAAGFDPQRVIEVAKFAIDEAWPDLTLVIDVPPETGFSRTGRAMSAPRRNASAGQHMMFPDVHVDAMEARPLEFHRRVRELFGGLSAYYPRPVLKIDGDTGVDEVHARVVEALTRALG